MEKKKFLCRLLTSLLLFNEQMKLLCMKGLSHAGYWEMRLTGDPAVSTP